MSSRKVTSGNEARQLMVDAMASFLEESPKEVKGVANTTTLYYARKLLRTVKSIFIIDDYPETWDYSYTLTNIFKGGYVGICDTAVGNLALKCSYTGINVFDKPTKLVFANPVLGTFEKTIDEDCVMLYLNDDFKGIMDMITQYSVLLAMCESAISVNLMNSKLAYVFTADNKQKAETLKKMYDDISVGKPAVFVRGEDFDVKEPPVYVTKVKDTFVGNEIEELQHMIYKKFLLDIGINAINDHKRERQTITEVGVSVGQCFSSVYDWFINLSKGIEKANKMFDLNMKIRFNDFVIAGLNEDLNNGEFQQSNTI